MKGHFLNHSGFLPVRGVRCCTLCHTRAVVFGHTIMQIRTRLQHPGAILVEIERLDMAPLSFRFCNRLCLGAVRAPRRGPGNIPVDLARKQQ